MPKLRYVVAMSLDGYIAGPNGEADWIVMDPQINFAELWAQFDTLLMGRRTYEAAIARLGKGALQRKRVAIASRTLRAQDHPETTILSEVNRDSIQSLRAKSSKDIWLMGGGELFSCVLGIGEVDTVEVSIMPVLLGAGVHLISPAAPGSGLKLSEQRVYPSGVVSLVYEVQK